MKLQERINLQRAYLIGAMFHDPEKGSEMYANMLGALSDEDMSDEAWLLNPDAKTDLTALEGILRRKEQENAERGTTEADSGGDATGDNV